MFEFYNGRTAKPEKERVLKDIADLFAHTVKITDGEMRIYESAEKPGLVFVNVKVGFMMKIGQDLQRLSDISKNVFYMAAEPEENMLSIRFGIEDVFEE